MTSKHDLLTKSFEFIKCSISKRGKFKINKRIQMQVLDLKEKYGLKDDEIVDMLFDQYLESKYYEEYDENRSKLSTFVVNYVDKNISNITNRYRRQNSKKNRERIPINKYSHDPIYWKGRCSYADLEELCHESTVEPVTPEDILIENETIEQIAEHLNDHFGEYDLLVLLGRKDRTSAAKENGKNYWAYCKHLRRKVDEFMEILEKFQQN